MPTASPCQQTGRQIRRNEGRPPLLGLAHVSLLMVAKPVQTACSATENHVPQRHRVESNSVAEPAGEPAMELQRPRRRWTRPPVPSVTDPAISPTKVVGAAQV